jgi:hypothetical protein
VCFRRGGYYHSKHTNDFFIVGVLKILSFHLVVVLVAQKRILQMFVSVEVAASFVFFQRENMCMLR